MAGLGYALIAEFDRAQAALYSEVVEAAGLEAIVVRDGNAGKTLLQTRGAPALLITDPSLPGSDGLSVITDLRQRFPTAATAIVVWSAFSELRATAASRLVSLGIFEVGEKKTSPALIRDAVTRALASASQAERPSLTAAPAPEDFSHEFLRDVARKFQVPIALLSIDVPQHQSFTAVVGIGETASAQHDTQLWGTMFRQVFNSRQPLVIPDLAPLFGTPLIVAPLRVRGLVSVPCTTSGHRLIGVLTLLDLKPLTFSSEQIDELMEVAQPMADQFARRYLSDPEVAAPAIAARTEESWAALERLALTDALTGLCNRHAGEQAIAREAARNRRTGSDLSLALLDLDNFKQVNDLHGHDAGDRVLAEVGRILKASFRASDLAIRWGGDEFLVLLPDVPVSGALTFAERARMQVEALSFSGVGLVTLSAGVVELGRGEEAVAALKRADANLYGAKAAGRNRVTTVSTSADPRAQSG